MKHFYVASTASTLLYIFLVCFSPYTVHAQTTSSSGPMLREKGVLSVKTSTLFSNANNLTEIWAYTPVPVSFYSEREVSVQKTINEKGSDAILVYSPKYEKRDWTSIDSEEITPYTWKWIELELLQEDGSVSEINLRRPHWWIKSIGADSIGKRVFIEMPEMGISGLSIVKNIYANQLDTRFWDEKRMGDYVYRPITGKFVHTSSNVYDLYFENNNYPLGVTGNHPIWSVDRVNWIPASQLLVGEKVRTRLGYTKLTRLEKRSGSHLVYNLEIYKDHNFLVSLNAINVHNDCFDNLRKVIAYMTKSGDPLMKFTEYFSVRMVSELDKTTGVFRILATTLQANGPSNPGAILGVIKKMKQMAVKAGAKTIDIRAEGLSTNIAKGIFKNRNGEKMYGLTVEYTEVDYGGMKVGTARIHGKVTD